MRRTDIHQGGLFSYVSLEERIPLASTGARVACVSVESSKSESWTS